MIPVIMAGGSGTRLWPLSRTEYPKQFLALINKHSMLQNTINRIKELQHSAPIIICNNEHRFLVSEQLKQIGSNTNGIILEPCGRNTAPAIALAALRAMELEEDPVLLVLAADHSIDDEDIFINSILHAFPHALNNKLVTFGVTPSKPETGYGYIKIGETL
ncbi:sugar phosphate nucleotidyltransferase, partial [Escherichia coli]|uniref:sugar phosphate nucleotidyltransferase n=1 Tax=Escherichia coli TaxID=562 RepID=UPI002023A161